MKFKKPLALFGATPTTTLSAAEGPTHVLVESREVPEGTPLLYVDREISLEDFLKDHPGVSLDRIRFNPEPEPPPLTPEQQAEVERWTEHTRQEKAIFDGNVRRSELAKRFLTGQQRMAETANLQGMYVSQHAAKGDRAGWDIGTQRSAQMISNLEQGKPFQEDESKT